jgi:CoA:oxalate CoA-transferase
LKALGNPPALMDDARFGDHWGRCSRASEIVAILDPIFAAKPRAYWLEHLTREGDLPVCAINTTAQAAEDPQALLNGYITTYDHPSYGPIKIPGFPVTLSETPARIHRQAPEFGEHSEQLLIERLGMDWDEISALRDRKVI